MRFVIVDDSGPMRNQLHRILRDAGHEIVGEGTDGADVPDLIDQLKPDAITLDISMRRVNGDIVAKQLLDAGEPQFVFIVSSMSQESIYQPLIDRGATFISKPYRPETLLRILNGALHGKP